MDVEAAVRLPERGAPGPPGRPCSIAEALKIVGERWTLLAVREIYLGNHRFDQLARNTGASRDILTARLRGLEAAGIIYRRRYHDHPPRFEYHLTEAGMDLRRVLNSLRIWGERWLVDEPPVVVEHKCGHELKAVTRCAHCGADIDPGGSPDDWSVHFVAPGWDRSGPV